MTTLVIDVRNQATSTHPDDQVMFYAPEVRARIGGGLVSTAPETVDLVDGQATIQNVEPGPIIVRLMVRGIADTAEKFGIVPDSGEVTLDDVLALKFTWTPPVITAGLQQIIDEMNRAIGEVGSVVEGMTGPLRDAATSAAASAASAEVSAGDAASEAAGAREEANSADLRADAAEASAALAIQRVAALEGREGLAPEAPVDGQTANIILQSDSLTRAAVGTVAIPRVTTAEQESATLGPELVTASGWSLGEGWSGNFEAGFTKTPGGTGMLRWNPPFSTGTDVYLVEWKWDGTATHQDVYAGYDVYFGQGYAGITYQGGATNNTAYSRAIASAQDGYLAFMPWDTFEGRIHSVSVRRVVAAAPVGIGWRTSANTRGGELRFGDPAAQSVFLGIDSGRYNISGRRNAAVGAFAMSNNVTGFYNSAFGWGALQRNINGTRNTALGYNALGENTAGDRNVAIGPFALTRNTTGQRNVAVGTDVLWRNVDGSDNIGIGYLTQTELRTGFSNVAIGKYAMRHTHGATFGGTKYNVAIGEEALGFVLGEGNVAIGMRAAAYHTGNNNVAIGRESLEYSTTAGSQTAIGRRALRYFTGGRNTALGHASLAGVQGESTGERNVAVGDNSGLDVTSGSMNTILGPSAGGGLSTGSRNIVMGFAAGVQLVKAGDDQLDIGNALYGDLAQKRIGVGHAPHQLRGVLHLRASTGQPGDAPIKLERGPLLLDPETGTLEFNADKLYFTTTNGNRREIAFVTTPEPEPEPEPEPTP